MENHAVGVVVGLDLLLLPYAALKLVPCSVRVVYLILDGAAQAGVYSGPINS